MNIGCKLLLALLILIMVIAVALGILSFIPYNPRTTVSPQANPVTTTTSKPVVVVSTPTTKPVVVVAPASNKPTVVVVSDKVCEDMATQYLAKIGKVPGRTIQKGSWSHVPKGCTVQSTGDWAIHYNTHPTGNDTVKGYTSINQNLVNTTKNVPAAPVKPEDPWNASICERLATQYLNNIGKPQRKRNMTVGSFAAVPRGCTVRNGGTGDWPIIFNGHPTGVINPSYTIINNALVEKSKPAQIVTPPVVLTPSTITTAKKLGYY